MGIRVPKVALYHLKVEGRGAETLGSFYFTLVEFIEGASTPDEKKAEDKKLCADELVKGCVFACAPPLPLLLTHPQTPISGTSRTWPWQTSTSWAITWRIC